MRKALAPDTSTWPRDDPQVVGSRCADVLLPPHWVRLGARLTEHDPDMLTFASAPVDPKGCTR
jgi:hypothetical protein